MIGVVGAEDSVRLVEDVAAELDLGSQLLVRTYSTPRDAVAIARELDTISSVILFTGRLPYILASSVDSWQARLEYIPHEGTDLYRTLANLLLRPGFAGRVPRLSLDSIEEQLVTEAFADLGVPAPDPDHILDLELVRQDFAFDPSRLARAHAALYEAGSVEVCLTCVEAVHRELERAGVPSVRIVHSRLVVREALGRSHLSVQLAKAEAAQIAVCVVAFTGSAGRLDGARASKGRIAQEVGRRYGSLLGGRVVTADETEAVIHTSRGAVERHLRAEAGDPSSVMRTEFRDLVSVGIGFGANSSIAEEHARRAVAFAKRERVPCLYTDDGTVVPIGPSAAAFSSRETRDQHLRIAEDLGLSPTSLRKLLGALRELDPAAFTARQLAAAYGVQSRSARRIIVYLERAGLVEPAGVQQGPGAGRPQVVYRLDPSRLVSLPDVP